MIGDAHRQRQLEGELLPGELLRSTLDPLLAAMIGKLPPHGPWPAAARTAWLKMMAMAFDVAYGLEDGIAAASPARRAEEDKSAPPKPLGPIGPVFYIDAEGFARKRGGERVLPSQVADILFDQRGVNGDLATIIWADGAKGIPKGVQLDIHASP